MSDNYKEILCRPERRKRDGGKRSCPASIQSQAVFF